MCGLAGRFHPAALPDAPGWAERADALLAHRGPDGAGRYGDGRCELVHRRLALLDLSPTGQQPMPNEDESVFVVFNGEIYNHRELRARLARRGHGFRGMSDTEVLVHLYEEDGPDLVHQLQGMFAFAVYDRDRRQLVLARDRFGVKPLFYAAHARQLVFASEIKAILALPDFVPWLDRQACYDFLGLGYVPEPATGFGNVRALPPGSLVVASARGCSEVAYHRVAACPDPARGLELTVGALEGTLLDAVAAQAVADVPVAALLSGGIDSSLVVAAHARATGTPIRTFNVRFPDPRHDETPTALAAAAHCGTEHRTVDLDGGALTTDAILALLRHFDQPFADPSCIPTYWLATTIRQAGYTCALSGDGGDEAFGGYAPFWRANRLMRLMGLPGWVRRAGVRVGTAVADVTRDWGRQLAKAARLSDAGHGDAALLLAGLSNYLSEEEKAALLDPAAREALLPVYRLYDGYPTPAVTDLEELSRRITEKLFAVSLPSNMLRKVDMMSMRAGIEVRVPLLDESLVAMGLRLPHRLKTDGRSGKLVLRALARRWLPANVATHPKHGFTIPLDRMVPAGFHDALEDLLGTPSARTRTMLNGAVVRRWLDAFRQAREQPRGGAVSRGGLYQRVLTLLALELWLREHHLTW